MDKTAMQYRIELSVSGGLGYDTKTDFSKTYSIYSGGLRPDDVKNTSEGMRAHLREITRLEHKKYGIPMGFVFSSSGGRMSVTHLGKYRVMKMILRNQKLIDRAYAAEAKRKGRILTLVDGFMMKRGLDNLLFSIGDVNRARVR